MVTAAGLIRVYVVEGKAIILVVFWPGAAGTHPAKQSMHVRVTNKCMI